MSTETKPNIYQRMLAVMEAVAYIQKGEKRVNNQYTFVSHDAVTAALRPALVKNGIVVITTVLRHAQVDSRTEADVRVDFVNADNPDDRVSVESFGYGADPMDKGPGKAISYAVKYAYLKAFALETGDDPDHDQRELQPVDPKAAHAVADLCIEMDECEDREKWKAFYRQAAKAAMGNKSLQDQVLASKELATLKFSAMPA